MTLWINLLAKTFLVHCWLSWVGWTDLSIKFWWTNLLVGRNVRAKIEFWLFFLFFFPASLSTIILSFISLLPCTHLQWNSWETLNFYTNGNDFSLSDDVKSNNTSSTSTMSYRSHHRNNLSSNQVNTHPSFLACSHNRKIINKRKHIVPPSPTFFVVCKALDDD